MRLDRNTVFDYKTHKENFFYYLEVVILEDGKIVYAVPSHQEKLIELYCKKYNISREELIERIPLYESPNDWIIYNLGVISVWYDFIIRPEQITDQQKEALEKLVIEECIYPKYTSNIIFKNEYGNLNYKEEEKMITDREKALLNKIIDGEKLEKEPEDIGYDKDSFIASNFTKEEIIDDFWRFCYDPGFVETKLYKEIIMEHIGKFNTLNLMNKEILLPKYLKSEELFKLLDSDFSTYLNKTDLTKKYFYIFNNKEYLVKYKDNLDWDYIIENYIYNITDDMVKIAADKLLEISYSKILPIVKDISEKISNEKSISYSESYYFGVILDKLDRLNSIHCIDIASEETVKHLLKCINSMYFYIEKYTEEEYGIDYEKDITEFYSNMYKDFSDEYIINNIDLFDSDSLIKANRLTEDILSVLLDNIKTKYEYLEGTSEYGIVKKYLTKNKDVSLDFLRKYKDELDTIHELYLQKEIINLYKEDSKDLDFVSIYFYNEYLTSTDIEFLLTVIKITYPSVMGITNIFISINKTELANSRFVNLIEFYNKGDNNE